MEFRTNNDYFSIQYQLVGFYNRDRVFLLRGTDCDFNETDPVSSLQG
jgi:hypothetical protein